MADADGVERLFVAHECETRCSVVMDIRCCNLPS
jgi:hypothetical protein